MEDELAGDRPARRRRAEEELQRGFEIRAGAAGGRADNGDVAAQLLRSRAGAAQRQRSTGKETGGDVDTSGHVRCEHDVAGGRTAAEGPGIAATRGAANAA